MFALRRGVLLLLILLPLCLPAQQEDGLRLIFGRQNDFTWSTQLSGHYDWQTEKDEGRWRIGHSNIYSNSSDPASFVQSLYDADIQQYRRIGLRFDAAFWGETSGNFSNATDKAALYGGLRIRPLEGLAVVPMLGYAWDRRLGLANSGFSPALRLEGRHAFDNDLDTYVQGLFQYKFLEPRRQKHLNLRMGLNKRFGAEADLSPSLTAVSMEVDDYQGNSVKRILSDTLVPEMNARYNLGPFFVFQSQNSLLLHRRRFLYENFTGGDPEQNNLNFDGVEAFTLQKIDFRKGRLSAFGAYSFMYSSRKYLLENSMDLNPVEFEQRFEKEQEKDFLKKLHKLEFYTRYSPGRHEWEFQLSNQYLQYDTPSETNYDDRDELSWYGLIKWRTAWNRRFRTNWGISGNYRHYAFLFAEKSQENYVQRSLRLDYGFDWEIMPGLRFQGDNAIYVTYNVKDFTDFNLTDRSTRNLETNFSLDRIHSDRFRSSLRVARKERHQSYLNWAEFSETTLDTNRFFTLEQLNRLEIALKEGAVGYVELGYKHFSQVKKQRASMLGLDNALHGIYLRQSHQQTGPVINFGFRNRRGTLIDAGVWLQMNIRSNRYADFGTPDFIGQTFQEADLMVRQQDVRPYVKLNVWWAAPRLRRRN